MKSAARFILIFILLINALPVQGKRCTGSAYCTACTNCSQCRYCKAGGTCGVCSGNTNGPLPDPGEDNSYHKQHADEYELPADNSGPSAPIHRLYESPQTSATTGTTSVDKSSPYLWFLVVGLLLYLLFRQKRS